MGKRLRSLCVIVCLAGANASASPVSPSPTDQAAIKIFLTKVYTSYKECKMQPGSVMQTKCIEPVPWKSLFVPSTLALIEKNERLNNGEAGVASEADPICSCQDYGTLRVISIDVTAASNARLTAKVRFFNLGPAVTTLIMEKTSVGWRVFDVLNQITGPGKTLVSYRTGIITENALLSKSKNRKS